MYRLMYRFMYCFRHNIHALDTIPVRCYGVANHAIRRCIMRMLKPKDVQAALNIHQSTMYRMLKSGAIRSVKIGGIYRIPQEALDELVGCREVQDEVVL